MNGLILRRRAKMETPIDLAAKLPQCIVVSFMRWLLHFYNLGNFLRTLAAPEPIKDWSMTTLKEKLIKIGAKVVMSWPLCRLPDGRGRHSQKICSPISYE